MHENEHSVLRVQAEALLIQWESHPTLYQGGAFDFEVEESVCTLEYRMNGIRGDVRRHIDEWSLGFFAVLLAERMGNGWLPSRTEFTNAPPADLNELHRVFGRHIVFNAPKTSFEFDAEILHRCINVANEGLLEILSDQAEAHLRGIQKYEASRSTRHPEVRGIQKYKASRRRIPWRTKFASVSWRTWSKGRRTNAKSLRAWRCPAAASSAAWPPGD